MNSPTNRLHLIIWLVVAALVLGSADDGWAGKKKNKKKKKKKKPAASSETVTDQQGAAPQASSPPPKVVRDIERRLLAYDTAGARSLLANEAVGSDVHLQIAEGRVLAQEGKYGDATSRLSAAADSASSDPAPLVYLGEAYLRAENSGAANQAFAGAEKRARAILNADPDNSDALLHLGVAQQRQKRFGEAVETLEAARRVEPRNAVIAYQLGASQAFKKDWTAAVDTLTAAIGLDAGIAYAYYYRGLSAGEAGRKDLLVNDLDRFLAMAPDAPEAAQVKRILGGL